MPSSSGPHSKRYPSGSRNARMASTGTAVKRTSSCIRLRPQQLEALEDDVGVLVDLLPPGGEEPHVLRAPVLQAAVALPLCPCEVGIDISEPAHLDGGCPDHANRLAAPVEDDAE